MLEFTTIAHHANLSVDATQVRQTPPPAERRFAEALAEGVSAVVDGAGTLAAATMPGGAVLAAATRALTDRTHAATGTGGGAAGTGERPEGPGAGDAVGTGGGNAIDEYWRLQQQSQDFNLQFLQLQEGLSQENRRFSALSNVLKARHDTSKAVIQNIR